MAGTLTVRELLTRWGFKGDTKGISRFDKAIAGVKRGMKIAGGVAAGLAVGMYALVQKTANYADKIAKASLRVGVGTDTLQALSHAAQLSGTNLDDMVTGLRSLARVAYDASEGSKMSADAFEELGITVTDASGSLKTNEQLLLETLGALADMTDETKKVALAQKLLGRSGTSMLPMLEGGRAGLEAMMKEAKRLGLILDKEAIKQSVQFNDSLQRLKTSVGVLVMKFASKLMPIIREWIEKALEWFQANRELIAQKMPEMVESLALSLKKIGAAIEWIVKIIGWMYDRLEAVGTFLGEGIAKIYLAIQFVFGGLWKGIKWVGEKFDWLKKQVFGFVASAWEKIKGFGASIWNAIGKPIADAISSVASLFSGFFDWISGLFSRIGSSIGNAFGAAWEKIRGFFGQIKEGFSKLSSQIWNWITAPFKAAISWVRAQINALIDWGMSHFKLIAAVVPGMKEAMDKIQKAQAAIAKAGVAPGAAPLAAVIAPGAAPGAALGAGAKTLNVQAPITVTVPSGTSASEAERVADSVAAAMTKIHRRVD